MDRKSTFFDAISAEETAKIVKWASCTSGYRRNKFFPRPSGLMFDPDGPFFLALSHLYNKVVISFDTPRLRPSNYRGHEIENDVRH